MSSILDEVVGSLGEPLILVDVGASGQTPRMWQGFAKRSVYVGFDPDAREVREERAGNFARAVYLNEAVTGNPTADGTIRFYLTRWPYCSSTLKPNTQVTDAFLSAPSFHVEGEATARATTVARALEAQGLSHVDWLKVDTQGTDLSIVKSLPEAMRQKLLAVDVEPGLRGAYVGEELFSDVHGLMQREGFWLSRMQLLGFPRMRRTTLDDVSKSRGLTDEMINKAVRKTPGWAECRYLRTLEALAATGASRREYVILWAFAHADEQWGYCLDVAAEFARRFPGDALAPKLSAEPLAQIERTLQKQAEAARGTLLGRVKRRVKSMLGRGPKKKPEVELAARPPGVLLPTAASR